MNIHFQTFSHYAVAIFKENVLPTLTAQQKRICIVASIALGCLVTCYLACRYRFQAEPSHDVQQKDLRDEESPIVRLKEQEKGPSQEHASSTEILPLRDSLSQQDNDNIQLDDLPEDALVNIFKQLDLASWESLLFINKKFHAICLNPKVATFLLEEDRIPLHLRNKEMLLKLAKCSGLLLRKLTLEGGYDLTNDELKKIFSTCPHLEELNLAGSGGSLTANVLNYLPKNLHVLDLSWWRYKLTDPDLECLQTLSHLQHLNLNRCTCLNDNGLKHLKTLSKLQFLDLTYCQGITDDGLEHLKALTALQSLNLHGCERVTKKGLKHLKELSHLHSLDLAKCKKTIIDNDVEHLKVFSALQSLDLSESNWLTDDSLKHLQGISTLQSLNLCNCKQITDHGVKHLKALTTLQSLDLSYCDQITDEGLQHLKELSALQSLHLVDCDKITDQGLEYLKSLSLLQSLKIIHCNITDNGLEHLKTLSALKSLYLWNCRQINDHGLKHLTTLSTLQELDLSDCKNMTDHSLESLKNLSTLQKLSLSGCEKITDEGVIHLKALSHLRYLSLYTCKITDKGLEHLKTLSHLQSVELLRRCPISGDLLISDKSLEDLKKALPLCEFRID